MELDKLLAKQYRCGNPDAYEAELSKLEERLKEAEKVIEFYADPEMWMIKNNDGWIQNSPKSHGDNELIQSYKHPKTDWIGSIQVGGRRAREYLEKRNIIT